MISSGCDVTGHKGLTTTFYGHRVIQKISFQLDFLMPCSWYDFPRHEWLTTTFYSHHVSITKKKVGLSTHLSNAFFIYYVTGYKGLLPEIPTYDFCIVQLKWNIGVSTCFHTALFIVWRHWSYGLNYYVQRFSRQTKNQPSTRCFSVFLIVWRQRSHYL